MVPEAYKGLRVVLQEESPLEEALPFWSASWSVDDAGEPQIYLQESWVKKCLSKGRQDLIDDALEHEYLESEDVLNQVLDGTYPDSQLAEEEGWTDEELAELQAQVADEAHNKAVKKQHGMSSDEHLDKILKDLEDLENS